jgi:hypothetical protein
MADKAPTSGYYVHLRAIKRAGEHTRTVGDSYSRSINGTTDGLTAASRAYPSFATTSVLNQVADVKVTECKGHVTFWHGIADRHQATLGHYSAAEQATLDSTSFIVPPTQDV